MELLAQLSLGPAVALGLSSVAVAASLTLIDRMWEPAARRRHNDIIGFIISAIAAIYAILLGFVTLTVWESYDKAAAAVDTEVNLVADLHRDAGSLPATAIAAIRRELVAYLRTVIDREWPAQTAGTCEARKSALAAIPRHLQMAAKSDPAAAPFIGEMISRLNALYDARRARLFACNRAIPAPIWTALAAGSISLIGCSLFFGCHDRRVHLTISATLSTSIMLVLWIIVVLSTPFQGVAAIPPDLYRQTLDFLMHAE